MLEGSCIYRGSLWSLCRRCILQWHICIGIIFKLVFLNFTSSNVCSFVFLLACNFCVLGINVEERVGMALYNLWQMPSIENGIFSLYMLCSHICVFVLNVVHCVTSVGKGGLSKAYRLVGFIKPWDALGMEKEQTWAKMKAKKQFLNKLLCVAEE